MDAHGFRLPMLSGPGLTCIVGRDALHRTLLQLGQTAGVTVQLSFRAVMWKHQPQAEDFEDVMSCMMMYGDVWYGMVLSYQND